MTANRPPGRSLVTRRALVDIVRPAVAGSYGVTGLGRGGILERIAGALGLRTPGIDISLADGLSIDLHLTVAYGLPVAEVARQADSAVRYAIRRATAREVDRLTIHVGGMHDQPLSPAAREAIHPPERPETLAAAEAAEAEAAAARAAAAEAVAERGGGTAA